MDYFNNRSFRYGDALFETLCVREGAVLCVADHWQRLSAGMAILRLEMPPNFEEKIQYALQQAAATHPNARLRLHVWREGAGAYLPESNLAAFHLSATPLPYVPHTATQIIQEVAVFEDVTIAPSVISPLKTANSLPYILAARFAQSLGVDDALLLNMHKNMIEISNANIFWIQGGTLYTPPLADGCIEGIYRKKLMEFCAQAQIPCLAASLTRPALREIDALFATNIMRGIQPILRADGVTLPSPHHPLLQRCIAEFQPR